jgi:hypothetical protein
MALLLSGPLNKTVGAFACSFPVPIWSRNRAMRRELPIVISEGRFSMGTILIIILILLLLGAWPSWPYSRNWGYYPSSGLGLVLVIVLVLALMGRI